MESTKLSNQVDWLDLQTANLQAQTDFLQASTELEAAKDFYDYDVKKDRKGFYVDTFDTVSLQHPKAVALHREGLESDIKQRANANWRSNVSSFTPFVTPLINNATSFGRGARVLRRSPRRIP